MSVVIKTAEEIELMRESGRILAAVHQELGKMIKPGMSTKDVDILGEEMIRSYGCEPSFLNYNGYPASICVSVNEEVVHGIPHPDHIIQDGDIVSLDAGVIYKGYHSDAARTIPVGDVSPEALKLIEVTKKSFFAGITLAVPGIRLHDISAAIGNFAEGYGYGVVQELCGHGIGKNLHEDPNIPNFAQPWYRPGVKLKKGMALAIEPMINMGSRNVVLIDDDWTVETEDLSLSAHYENTIIITDDVPEILTLTMEEKAAGLDKYENWLAYAGIEL